MGMNKIKVTNLGVVGVTIVIFITVIRYFKDTILISNTIASLVALFGALLLAFSNYKINKGKLKIDQIDYFWMLIFFLYSLVRNPSYVWINVWMCVIGIIVYFSLGSINGILKYGFIIIVVFALLTASVTWYSLINYEGYCSLIAKLYTAAEMNSILSWYRQGMLSGLTFHYSNNTFYMISAIFIIYSVLISKSSKLKLLYIIAGYLLITVMVVGKRGPIVFAVISIIISYLFLNIKKNKKIERFLLVVIVLIVISPIIISKVPEVSNFYFRLISSSGDYLSGRGDLYSDAINMFFSSPIIGRGYGTFFVLKNGANSGVHNDYLQFLAEWGGVGFFICLIAYGGALYRSYKYYREAFVSIKATQEDKLLATWSFLFQVFVMLYSLTGIPHYDWEIFILFCIACSIPRYRRKRI